MPDFTIHVQLPGAEPDDYDLLRLAMEEDGFACIVRDSDGTPRELPAGDYALAGDFTAAQVLARTFRVLGSIAYSYSVIVEESPDRIWWGLEPAV
jgi:hypothetical protein